MLGASPVPFDPLKHAVHGAEYWKTHKIGQASDLSSKVASPPAELLDYLDKENQLQGYAGHPSAPASDAAFLSDLKSAIAGLPASVRVFAAKRTVGIFVVRDLGSTAFTEVIYGPAHDPVGAFIVLDREALNRKANEWLVWKENSPFRLDGVSRLEGRLEHDRDNDRKHAIEYILLHEIGHVLAAVGRLEPSWDEFEGAQMDSASFPFSRFSWLYAQGRYSTRFEEGFPARKDVHFYGEPARLLPAAQITGVYQQLGLTDFPTLYAATNPHDDFAESFANYVHVVLMKRPYQLLIMEGRKQVGVFGACWADRRCKRKKDFLDRMFAFTGAL